MTNPASFFDPLKFMLNGLQVEENAQPDPDFEKKVALALQKEIKAVVVEMMLTDNKPLKNDLTTRLEKLQKIYQSFIKGDNISKIIKVVDNEMQSVADKMGLSTKDRAALLEAVKAKLTQGAGKNEGDTSVSVE